MDTSDIVWSEFVNSQDIYLDESEHISEKYESGLTSEQKLKRRMDILSLFFVGLKFSKQITIGYVDEFGSSELSDVPIFLVGYHQSGCLTGLMGAISRV